MEVRIGIQHHSRELVVDTDESSESVEQQIADAVSGNGVLSMTDNKGRKLVVPANRIAYVEIGGGAAGQVGFRS